jgi:hypothetical protein
MQAKYTDKKLFMILSGKSEITSIIPEYKLFLILPVYSTMQAKYTDKKLYMMLSGKPEIQA